MGEREGEMQEIAPTTNKTPLRGSDPLAAFAVKRFRAVCQVEGVDVIFDGSA